MNNPSPDNKIDQKLDDLISNVRKTILLTNLSLAKTLETPFMATYENENGICSMGVRMDGTAILIASSVGGNLVFKTNFVIAENNSYKGKALFINGPYLKAIGERRSVIQCEDEESAVEIYDLLSDKMYAWTHGELESVELD